MRRNDMASWSVLLFGSMLAACSQSNFSGSAKQQRDATLNPGSGGGGGGGGADGGGPSSGGQSQDSGTSGPGQQLGGTGSSGQSGSPGSTSGGQPSVDGSANGTQGGVSTDASKTQPASVVSAGGVLTVNAAIKKISVDAMIDHDSILVVGPTTIFWDHKKLGAPGATSLSFYDANGALINSTPWHPKFTPGSGANCPASVFRNGVPYCEDDCDCQSDAVQLTVAPALNATLTNETNMGTASGRSANETGSVTITPGPPIHVHILDCGSDCGRDVDYGLSGVGHYTFDIE